MHAQTAPGLRMPIYELMRQQLLLRQAHDPGHTFPLYQSVAGAL